MAITKLLRLKECKNGGIKAKHLKNNISYICDPEKTWGGRLISGNAGVTPSMIYQAMMQNKAQWNKFGGTQGFHYIIGFPKDCEISPGLAVQIAEEFCQKLFGENFLYVVAVHRDKQHVHAHITFDSVSRVDGHKFHSPKGDWEKRIQPITDSLCKKYFLPTLEYDPERVGVDYGSWKRFTDYKKRRDIRSVIYVKLERNPKWKMSPFQKMFYERWRNTYFIKPPEKKDWRTKRKEIAQLEKLSDCINYMLDWDIESPSDMTRRREVLLKEQDRLQEILQMQWNSFYRDKNNLWVSKYQSLKKQLVETNDTSVETQMNELKKKIEENGSFETAIKKREKLLGKIRHTKAVLKDNRRECRLLDHMEELFFEVKSPLELLDKEIHGQRVFPKPSLSRENQKDPDKGKIQRNAQEERNR